jgi:hypothetical protein
VKKNEERLVVPSPGVKFRQGGSTHLTLLNLIRNGLIWVPRS